MGKGLLGRRPGQWEEAGLPGLHTEAGSHLSSTCWVRIPWPGPGQVGFIPRPWLGRWARIGNEGLTGAAGNSVDGLLMLLVDLLHTHFVVQAPQMKGAVVTS